MRPDPDVLLPRDIRAKFTSLLDKYDHVFGPNIKGYNGAEVPFEARVNMVPVEPPPLPPPSGGSRLITAFADVGRYSKPQPSLMPDVDSTLRHIAQWKHIIATDLTSAF